VTSPQEAVEAQTAGADALVVQGYEAGGHRGSFTDEEDNEEFGLLALLRLVRRAVDVPLAARDAQSTIEGVAAAFGAAHR
jgi:nitronate monooxygenase